MYLSHYSEVHISDFKFHLKLSNFKRQSGKNMAIDSRLGKCVWSVESRTRGPMQSRTSSRLIEISNQTLRHAEAEQHLSIQIIATGITKVLNCWVQKSSPTQNK